MLASLETRKEKEKMLLWSSRSCSFTGVGFADFGVLECVAEVEMEELGEVIPTV
ncbi:hypothetical protein Droror1_Dr00024183 [Drosera rotundifolia]